MSKKWDNVVSTKSESEMLSIIQRKESFKSIRLNLIINAKFNKHAQSLLNADCKERIVQKFRTKIGPVEKEINDRWEEIFCKIIKYFEIKTSLEIPKSIANFLQSFLEIGAADFYQNVVKDSGEELVWKDDSSFLFVLDNKEIKLIW